jgi:hypothetical protein
MVILYLVTDSPLLMDDPPTQAKRGGGSSDPPLKYAGRRVNQGRATGLCVRLPCARPALRPVSRATKRCESRNVS